MAVPKEKVLPILKEKLKGKGYPTTFINKAAERYAGKIDTEDDIEEYVSDKVEDLIEADKEADRRATAATKKAQEDAAKKITGKSEGDEEETSDEDAILNDPNTPAYVKALYKQNKAIIDRQNAFESKQQQGSIEERFKKDERLKDVPAFILKGRVPTKDEDFETGVEDIVKDWNDYKQANPGQATRTIAGDRPRLGGAAGGNAQPQQQTEKVPDAIKQFTANLNKSNTVQKS